MIWDFGKTLQVLTLIKSGNEKSIVIAPTSLVYNWGEEVKKFVPDINVCIISGSKIEREEKFCELEKSDLIVTSYALLRRDFEKYEKYHFKYCFLDEAQHIKNYNTVNSKVVRGIKAKTYFALTGTPIENNLTEIWSILDFVLPGYLGSHHKFKKDFEVPIIKYNDEEKLNQLSKLIQPFLLRRLKKNVLKELPEKVETKLIATMTDKQSKLYISYLAKAKQDIISEINENGYEKSQIKILSILTRLRQICCDPSLFLEDYHNESGKLDLLLEILDSSISSDHRVLLFSQFTSMLDIIEKVLNKNKISYFRIDGKVKSEDRLDLVNRFNGGEKSVFLISLKAGGTGLNLTGADTVIHYDPWWNPAVLDQATDRAYRMGQEKSVQVYNLITKDTIEEKIYELLDKKKDLINSVIKPGEKIISKLTQEEIKELFCIG